MNGKGAPGRPQGRKFEDDKEPSPLPLGDQCNPLCPFFRCSKKALKIDKKYVRASSRRSASACGSGITA